MEEYEQKKELLKKYYTRICTSYGFCIIDDFPARKINNAKKSFAFDVNEDSIIGFYDTTIAGNGKAGYLFTDTKVYYLETLGKPHKLWYDEVKDIELSDTHKKDCDRGIRFYMKDGSTILWTSVYLNKTPLRDFFKELLDLDDKERKRIYVDHPSRPDIGARSGGLMAGNYGTVNKLYCEEKFHARQGHGFAAERANDLFERLTGHKTSIIGDSNEKNGADRLSDGIYIQSKYCATGSRCINECFEDKGRGGFRYLKNGQPMKIEVPSDKYEDAIQAMEEKIRRGQVNGITDIEEAKKIVRKGHFTYEQAKNIAKAGTVESLTYDAVSGVVSASTSFGVTGILAFASSLWNGECYEDALKVAVYSGLKVGGAAFATGVIASQLSKAGINNALIGSSEAIISIMGPKASAVLINAFRSGSNIYGAAAMKSAAKLLRGNTVTAGISMIVLSTGDIANIFRGRISKKQLFKNLTNTASTVAGGFGGWLAGAAAGSMVFPGVGTLIGGVLGSTSVGSMAGKTSDKVLSCFFEDDADEMLMIIEKVFSNLAFDHLLNQEEAEKAIDHLSEILNDKSLKAMFANDDREKYAGDLLEPIIEKEIKKREKIKIPDDKRTIEGLRELLESIASPA